MKVPASVQVVGLADAFDRGDLVIWVHDGKERQELTRRR